MLSVVYSVCPTEKELKKLKRKPKQFIVAILSNYAYFLHDELFTFQWHSIWIQNQSDGQPHFKN